MGNACHISLIQEERLMKKIFGILTAMVLILVSAAWAGEVSLPKDLPSYKHAGSLIIPDKNSPLFGIHHFYLNKTGQAAFEKGAAYPKGTIFVGKVYEAVTTPEGALNEGKMLFQTYMKKDASAKDTGGWIFAAFTPDGKQIQKDPKVDCFACHTAAKDSDYVFSKPLK
jgi:Cytochrome P460